MFFFKWVFNSWMKLLTCDKIMQILCIGRVVECKRYHTRPYSSFSHLHPSANALQCEIYNGKLRSSHQCQIYGSSLSIMVVKHPKSSKVSRWYFMTWKGKPVNCALQPRYINANKTRQCKPNLSMLANWNPIVGIQMWLYKAWNPQYLFTVG